MPTLRLSAQEAALAASSEAMDQQRWEEILARARQLSARAGQWGPFLDYNAVELVAPDDRVVVTVEADAWAPEQRALAARLLELADAEDEVPAAAARVLLQEACGPDALPWAGKPGLEVAERLGCWQAYASLRAARWGIREE